MRRSLLILTLAGLTGVGLSAHEIISTKLTWTEHVSRIFHRRCAGCHREGGSAPMPLATYDQVRPWAKAVKLQVLSRKMPPWDAVKGYGAFQGDISLSQDEIAVISSWVEGGAPRGDLHFLDVSLLESMQPEVEPPSYQDLPVAHDTVLDSAVAAVGVRLGEMEEGSGFELRARLPSGEVRDLIWIQDFRRLAPREYYFLEPVQLPRGSRLFVYPGKSGAALLVATTPP